MLTRVVRCRSKSSYAMGSFTGTDGCSLRDQCTMYGVGAHRCHRPKPMGRGRGQARHEGASRVIRQGTIMDGIRGEANL